MKIQPIRSTIVFTLLATSTAPAVVMVQTFVRPLAPNVLGAGPEATKGYIVNGIRYNFEWLRAPLSIDLDANGAVDLTIIGNQIVTTSMKVSLTGRNQVWALTGGQGGLDLGSHALALLGGVALGPGLTSANPRIGWHNDTDTQGTSILMQTYQGDRVSGAFFPSYPFEQKYLGVRFERDGAIHYGWMAISGFNNLGNELYIHAWAWESEPDTPLIVGQIPEPGTGLLAVTGCALLLRRRRRPAQSD